MRFRRSLLSGVCAAAAILVGYSCSRPSVVSPPADDWEREACEARKDSLGSDVAGLGSALAQHAQWRESKGRRGTRARLETKDLRNFFASRDTLDRADFDGSNLQGAVLCSAQLDSVSGLRVDLAGAELILARVRGANLAGAELDSADLTGADLTGSYLGCFSDNAGEYCADLRRAILTNANLSGVDLGNAEMSGAVYEPRSQPDIRGIATAVGLEYLTYQKDPSALAELRKKFQDGGYVDQERRITYALKTQQNARTTRIDRWANTIAFDWTTRYGLEPGARSCSGFGYCFC